MNNFKPSELPVATVIEHEDENYIKVDNPIYGLVWEPIRCVDCQGSIDVMNTQADTHFTDFKIISLPYGVVAELAMSLQDEYGNFDSEGEEITVIGLIKDAIDEHELLEQED